MQSPSLPLSRDTCEVWDKPRPLVRATNAARRFQRVNTKHQNARPMPATRRRHISPPTILRPLRPRHIPQRFCRSANPPRNRPALLSYACCSALGDRALCGVAVLPSRPPRSSLRTFQPALSGTDGGCRIRDGPGPRGLGAGRSGGGQMVCFSLWLLVSVVGVRRCCGVSRRLTRPIFSPAPTTEKK